MAAEMKPITGMSEIEAWRWLEKRNCDIRFDRGNVLIVLIGEESYDLCAGGENVVSAVLNARAELRKRGLPDE